MTYQAKGMPPFINVALSIPDWKNYVASYNFGQIPPSRIVLHHTWRPTVQEWSGLASMRGMQNYYAGLGWTAAPHLYAGPDGIWLATPMSEVGIHAGSGNSGNWNNGKWSYSLGLEMVGNYDSVRPSGAVWENSKAIMGELSKRLGIAPRQLIYFHRDFSDKSCPGWAVTKEWVWGEIEAYINNSKPPTAPPQGPIGDPKPDVEQLIEGLLNRSYAVKGEGYSSEWAFHQYAIKNNMGVPFAKSTRIQVEGKEYSYQPFACDTLYCQVPNWGDVKLLSQLLGGSIPPSGLGRALLEATYKAGGATFRADWAFHQYAMSAKLGPPVGESGKIAVDGIDYAFQVFAGDTLYNVIPKWSEIQQLSRLSTSTDAKQVKIREALLAETYKKGGATYHADWAFHQLARTLNGGAGIGAPLTESIRVNIGGKNYAIQVYALDTLYNLVPNWSDVKRMRALVDKGTPQIQQVASFSFMDTDWEPPDSPEFPIIEYSPSSPLFSSRGTTPVSLVMIHGDSGSSSASLERMTRFNGYFSSHYYIARDGTILQLVHEQYAAWHSGMATLGGVWFNTNKMSIGIVLEHMPEGYALQDGKGQQAQSDALRYLLRDLVKRHNLSPDDIVFTQSLATNIALMPTELLHIDIFG